MIDLIRASVGKNGKNDKNDVFIIQEVLNLYSQDYPMIPELDVDGKAGARTEESIYAFQKFVLKLRLPDAKIDKGGKTERIMVEKMEPAQLKQVVAKYRPEVQALPAVLPQYSIRYSENARREVSQYSENIVKLAMKFAKVPTLVFSSTRRTIADQARIMYANCSRYHVSSVAALKQARGWGYGPTGGAVEEVYFANKDKPQAEVCKAMEDKITTFLAQGKRTSLHCVDPPTYKTRNIIDIPYSSVAQGQQQAFQDALFSMAQKIQNASYVKLRQYDYIDLVIVEDQCWHLEIPQLGKELPG
jgi:peptidoglycan hydrolase-like protein with peptidoglycan-binding domain